MIEDLSGKVAGGLVSNAELESLLVLRHWRMRSLSDQGIKSRNTPAGENFSGKGEKEVGIIVARFVWNNCQNSFAGPDRLQGLRNNSR
jgi:hypothetical protein